MLNLESQWEAWINEIYWCSQVLWKLIYRFFQSIRQVCLDEEEERQNKIYYRYTRSREKIGCENECHTACKRIRKPGTLFGDFCTILWTVINLIVFVFPFVELPKPSLGDLSDLKQLSIRVRREKMPNMLGYQYHELVDIDNIKLDLIPEKKGLLLKHVEYEVTSQVRKKYYIHLLIIW